MIFYLVRANILLNWSIDYCVLLLAVIIMLQFLIIYYVNRPSILIAMQQKPLLYQPRKNCPKSPSFLGFGAKERFLFSCGYVRRDNIRPRLIFVSTAVASPIVASSSNILCLRCAQGTHPLNCRANRHNAPGNKLLSIAQR